ncbi:MAG: hypothetical protein KBC63_04465 [Candidatus Levybacteria bacterium]|nr:hypothetical protein [Candidatus Levybacteria bacterium]
MEKLRKSILFIVLFLVAQYLVGSLIIPVNTPSLTREFMEVVSHADVLYFGDSVIRTTSASDTERKPIFTYLQKGTPKLKIAGLTHDGFDSQIFYEYVKAVSKKEKKPSLIIFPINLRSFSDTWSYDFLDQKTYLSHMDTVLFPYMTFVENFVTPVFPQSYGFKGETVDYGDYKQQLQNVIKARKSTHDKEQSDRIAAYYLYTLTKNHKNLHALKESVKVLKESNVSVLFYITPIDYEEGREHYNNDFDKTVRSNIKTVKEALGGEGVVILDLSYRLPSSSFAWQGIGYINEHLNDHGRKFVAKEIARNIK